MTTISLNWHQIKHHVTLKLEHLPTSIILCKTLRKLRSIAVVNKHRNVLLLTKQEFYFLSKQPSLAIKLKCSSFFLSGTIWEGLGCRAAKKCETCKATKPSPMKKNLIVKLWPLNQEQNPTRQNAFIKIILTESKF